MGHGIFPNYGPTYLKSWQHQLSKEERKLVFYTTKKSLKKESASFKNDEEDQDKFKKFKK